MSKLMIAVMAAAGTACAFAGIKVPCGADTAALVMIPGNVEQEFVDDAGQFLKEVQFQTTGNWETSKRPEIYKNEKDVPAGRYIWYFGKAPDGVDTKGMKPHEGRWQITDKAAYFWGDKNGTRIAFYTFFEDAMGARYPFEKAITFPKSVVDPLDVSEKQAKGGFAPPFRVRRLRGKDRGGWRWSPRMRDGIYNAPAMGHAFSDWWGRYGATKLHPEYFSMRPDGVRAPVGFDPKKAIDIAASKEKPARYIALCVSNEGTVKQVVEDWRTNRGTAKPGYKPPDKIGLCENDCSPENICYCPECKKLDEPPATEPKGFVEWWPDWRADRYINFQKRCLAEAKKYNPNVSCTVYAYNPMAQAPRREKLTPDFEVGLVPTVFSLEWIEKFCKGWKDAGMTKCFYRPNRRGYFGVPYLTPGFEKHFFDLWKIMEKYGCDGFMEDCATAQTANGWLSDYVLYKAVQDPTKSFDFWENQYCEAFGAAKDDVKAYFRYYRGIFEKKIVKDLVKLQIDGKCFNYSRGLIMHLKDYYTVDDFTKGTAMLADALKKHEANLSLSECRALKNLYWAQKHAELTGVNLLVRSDETAKAVYDFRMKMKKDPFKGQSETLSKLNCSGRPFNSNLRGCWDENGNGDVERLQRWDVKPK